MPATCASHWWQPTNTCAGADAHNIDLTVSHAVAKKQESQKRGSTLVTRRWSKSATAVEVGGCEDGHLVELREPQLQEAVKEEHRRTSKGALLRGGRPRIPRVAGIKVGDTPIQLLHRRGGQIR
jgi:hypothetical protein